ncbi:hypothetical protein PR048_019178 [Dryococelus australis]|uniref:Uncharacterized protein n=1 Tax=Dryococelus australis TaxID=614101 RepID=A0ABQ9H2S4_9NEOP|nr:hypothetical protein PR048_019178 [Dryococelus australis]
MLLDKMFSNLYHSFLDDANNSQKCWHQFRLFVWPRIRWLASMSGRLQGCRSAIRRSYPTAVYVHCASHSLNFSFDSSLQPTRYSKLHRDSKGSGVIFYMPAEATRYSKKLCTTKGP